MAKNYLQTNYYQPMQKRGNTLLAVGGFLLMVGVAYFIYKKVRQGTQVKGSVKSTTNGLPLWSEIQIFDPTTSKVSVKGKTSYYTSVGVGAYVGEATGKIEKGSDGLFYRELVPPSDRKDMFKNSSGNIINKAYVLAKVTEGFK
jgi:hypothetical protein